MTDRYKGLAVTLEKDMRDDDAETLIQAILLLRGVADVAPIEADLNDQINRTRAKWELRTKLIRILTEDEA